MTGVGQYLAEVRANRRACTNDPTLNRLPADIASRYLAADGYRADRHGQIHPTGVLLHPEALTELANPSAIRAALRHIDRALPDDTAAAIDAAKELIESTAKMVLTAHGYPVDEPNSLPRLTTRAQDMLGVRARQASESGLDASAMLTRLPGPLTGLSEDLGELRNRGYGTGHGPASEPADLPVRHRRLAVTAAIAWCTFVLDTLSDQQDTDRAQSTGAPDEPTN